MAMPDDPDVTPADVDARPGVDRPVDPLVWPAEEGLHHLHPAAPRIWRVVTVSWAAVSGAAAIIAGLVIAGVAGAVIGAGVGAVVVALAWWYPARRYRYWRYRIGDDALELRRGVWFRSSSAVPFHRIQQIDVEQGPLQRRHEVVTLRLRTAAAASEGQIPHLAAAEADLLRDRLLAIARSETDDGH